MSQAEESGGKPGEEGQLSKRQMKKLAKLQQRQEYKQKKANETENPTESKPKQEAKPQQQQQQNQNQQQKQQNQKQQQGQNQNKQQQQKQGQKQQQNQGQNQKQQQQGQNQKGNQQQNQKQQNQGQKQQPKQQQQKVEKQPQAQAQPQKVEEPESEITKLFSHILVVEKCSSQKLIKMASEKNAGIPLHPALIEYVLSTSFDISVDENENCKRFMKAMHQMIEDEPISENERFIYSILRIIKVTMTLLNKIRMTTPGIGNCVRFIKAQLPKDKVLKTVAADEEFRAALLAAIDNFVREKIEDVESLLVRSVSNKLLEGDVVLTYGYSPIIIQALREASKEKKFRIIVVDSRPSFNSKRVVEQLPDLDVRYVLISGLSYVMPEVTKVLIEPSGILSNNAALTPVGTAMIAMVAHEFDVPVLFVCGSYKFVGDVRVDALAKNEILGPQLVPSLPGDKASKDKEYFALMYDVTPGEYVNVVISEIGENPVNSISTNMKYIQESYTFFSHTTNALKNKNKE